MSAGADCAPYHLQLVDDMHHDDAVMRPSVLCADTLAARWRQTGIEPTVVGAKARRLASAGRRGLVEHRRGNAGRQGHPSPDAVAAPMLSRTQLSPPIQDRAIVRMGQRTCGSTTQPPTVHHVFERLAIPGQLALTLLACAACAEAYQARWTVVRMWDAGGTKQNMAGGLQRARSHV